MELTPDNLQEETVTMAQKGLHIFTGTAKATGGQVSAKYTEWHIIDFKWDPEGKWRLSDEEYIFTIISPDRGKEI